MRQALMCYSNTIKAKYTHHNISLIYFNKKNEIFDSQRFINYTYRNEIKYMKRMQL